MGKRRNRRARKSAAWKSNPYFGGKKRRSRRSAPAAVQNSRRRHRNPGPDFGNLATALAYGAAGYAVSKGLAVVADKYLPSTVPYRTLIGSSVAAVAAGWAAQTVLKDKPRQSAAAVVGAVIPVAEELIAITPLGPMIGVYEGANVPGLPSPAPDGTTAGMSAALSAALNDSDDAPTWSANSVI